MKADNIEAMTDQELQDNINLLQGWIKQDEEHISTSRNQLAPLWKEAAKRFVVKELVTNERIQRARDNAERS